MPDDTDESRLIAKRNQKGVSPKKIIQNLQDEFLAQGLEAYDHFKRMSVGIDHDEKGEPLMRVAEDGTEIIEPIEEQDKASRLNVYGVFKMPNWLGDR